MTPYYQDELVVLYHGDCREVDAWLSADVLVSDPPYGMSYVSNFSRYGPTDSIVGDNDTELRDYAVSVWGSDRPALVFGSWRVARPVARMLLVWDKGDSPGMGDLKLPWGPSHEEVYVLGSGFRGPRTGSVLRFPTLPAAAGWRPNHPTPKPVALMETLIAKCPAGVVADPFAGSGSTLVAARRQGRPSVGVEIDERYCETIAQRLSQGDLFGGDAA